MFGAGGWYPEPAPGPEVALTRAWSYSYSTAGVLLNSLALSWHQLYPLFHPSSIPASPPLTHLLQDGRLGLILDGRLNLLLLGIAHTLAVLARPVMLQDEE